MASTLWRFDTTTLKNKSVSDAAQVPTAANINFYRRGATASQVVTIPVTINDPDPQPTSVNVYDAGTLAVGNTVLFDGHPTVQMTVAEVTSGTSLKLLNLTQTPIILGVGSRLVNSSPPRPTAYGDVRGTAALGNSITSDATTGRAGCYLHDSPIDYTVDITGLDPRLFTDVQGGASPRWLDARLFSSIQAAIDLLPAPGGVVYVPGFNEITETIVIPRDMAVHLIGDGPGRSVIYCANQNKDILWVKGSYSTIENLTIKGPGFGGSGRGIVLGLLASDSPTDVLRRVSIIGCEITLTANWALKFIDLDSPGSGAKSLSIWTHVERTVFSLNQTAGLIEIGRGNTTATFLTCALDHFGGVGLNAFNMQRLSLFDVIFEDKKDDISPYLILDGVENALVSGPWFETHDASDLTKPFIDIGPAQPCRDVSIISPKFARHLGAYPRMIRVGSSSKAVWISNPTCTLDDPPAGDRFTTTDQSLKDINVADGCEVHISGGVINKQSLPAQPLAMAASSPSRGAFVAAGPRVAVPRVTTVQRDEATSLAIDRKAGDVIFNSSVGGLQVWRGTEWSPAVVTAGGTQSQTGALFGVGACRVSAFVRLLPDGPGSVTVRVGWTEAEPPVQRTVTIVPAFGTQGGITNGSAFLVASGPLTYFIDASGFLQGGYFVEIHAESA